MVRSNKCYRQMNEEELRQAYQELKVAVAVPAFGNRVSLIGKYTKARVDLDIVLEIAKKRGIYLC